MLLKEGRNREVRRLWESQGCQVSRLKRIRYGKVELPQPLLRGQSQELPADKVEALRKRTRPGRRHAVGADAAAGDRPAQGGQVDRACRSATARSATPTSAATTRADEGRELRRFDNVREDRGRGRGGNEASTAA